MATTDEAIRVYKSLSKNSTVSKSNFVQFGNDFYVDTIWNQRNLERSKAATFRTYQKVDKSPLSISSNIFPPTEINNEFISTYKNGRTAMVQSVTIKDEKEPQQFLEIWNFDGIEFSCNLTKKKKHGKVHYNPHFGSIEWSPDLQRILYMAERKEEESRSYFADDDDKGNSAKKCIPGNKNLYRPNWGEQLTDCVQPTVCIYDIKENLITTFENVLPSEFSYGQGIWVSNDEFVVVGWKHEPYPLGLIYCTNRKGALYKCNISTKSCTRLTKEENHYSSPRANSKGEVFFLESPSHGPHFNCSKLWMVDCSNTSEPKIIVDLVKQGCCEKDSFPGLFVFALPKQCFNSDETCIITSSDWYSHTAAIKIDISTGKVSKLSGSGQWVVHDVCGDLIVASHSTPSQPDHIRIGKCSKDAITWTDTTSNSVANLAWNVENIKPDIENEKYPDLMLQCIVIKPKNFDMLEKKYLVVNPHGGPHTSSKAMFTLQTAALCHLGFAVVQVNYRGSTGFGANAINSLPGNIATQDVNDVQQCAEKCKRDLECDKVFITGGSHGGFLTLSLIGRFPDFYSAAISRNPVSDLVVMEGVSDIPDWVFLESTGEKFDHKDIPNPRFYQLASSKSPLHLVNMVKTPCMMHLGELDARVPPSQGLQWAKKYKALGGKCKILWYKEDCHPLSKVETEADCFVNMIEWIIEHSE